jgi:hypothetical protein
MPDPTQVDDELGRRLAAARSHSREDASSWAARLGKDRGTLRRYELGQIDPDKKAGIIQRYVEETDLPAEFFTIDFERLPEMVAAWQQVRQEGASPERLARAQEKDEEGTLPVDPTASRSEEREP